ncbi:alpha/beta hydrolase family protein [Polycladidibacter hongkongensis]|uniref:alpha/beta hydrolase family protein n=1 Tax=Polycladidibacter hongkongensis TaxID=1647556 RepID=UPI00082A9C56|nr:alpha/beta hydrolase [Pseudovibrio hongkongensis]
MSEVIQEEFTFPVKFEDGELELKGFLYRPANDAAIDKNLPPVVFNSGFTGGVSMYGQLVGNALAARGYVVTTYDVTGFFTNRAVRNNYDHNGQNVTNVSLEDQKIELLALIDATKQRLGKMPAVLSWAMGSVATLAAIADLAKAGKEQIAYFVPMNYTNLRALQSLRANPEAAETGISALDDKAGIPPFDLGTTDTQLGYYPLDPATQAYTDSQLGDYTEAAGEDRWPGCNLISAKSYKTYVKFDPEAELASVSGDFPPALIVHGELNSLHAPAESIRLHSVYPGPKGDSALIVEGMAHGQQNQADNPVFEGLIHQIDEGIRSTL